MCELEDRMGLHEKTDSPQEEIKEETKKKKKRVGVFVLANETVFRRRGQ